MASFPIAITLRTEKDSSPVRFNITGDLQIYREAASDIQWWGAVVGGTRAFFNDFVAAQLWIVAETERLTRNMEPREKMVGYAE